MLQEFENRLIKNYRHIGKWARRQHITCFRVYDSDLPSYPFAIDRYENFVHISEYKVSKESLPGEHQEWLKGCTEVISKTLQADPKDIFLKTRERQTGANQYEKLNQKSFGTWVEEFGARLWVNFTDYLDTGLFLDHRETRKWVRAETRGKRVLNLFAYTGAFSVQAAMGGASEVDTVDMSNAYLDWARQNMEANEFKDNNRFRYLREDITEWIKKPVEKQYDMIILDPPSFSNSKKMKGILDIQRDHPFLIRQAAKRLHPTGILYFSNNLRSFKLDYDHLQDLLVKDVTAASIPNDFRNKRIHWCYKIAKNS